MLSITHRGTGAFQSAVIYAFGLGPIFMNTTYPQFLAQVQSLGIYSPIIFTVKFGLAWSISYHLLNGLRHLVRANGSEDDCKLIFETILELGHGLRVPDARPLQDGLDGRHVGYHLRRDHRQLVSQNSGLDVAIFNSRFQNHQNYSTL